MKTNYSILFCGTGGQGVLKASEVCGFAAMLQGFHVRKSEVHGMAQRGGSVESHLVFGESVYSPIIKPGCADFLVAFDYNEGTRLAFYLREGGKSLISFLDHVAELPDSRFVNTYFLGALSASLPIEEKHWVSAIETVVGKKIDENKRVFSLGRRRAQAG